MYAMDAWNLVVPGGPAQVKSGKWKIPHGYFIF
jgi:hypothetical protein